MSEFATIVGFIAGLVTTAANFPQVWKTYRTKSGEGLSPPCAAHARHRSGHLDHLRNHDQVATDHRDKCYRVPIDIVVDWDEVEIRSCAHKRLTEQSFPNLNNDVQRLGP
jgi:hypothetical protein